MKPRGDSHRNSHKLQGSVSVADNLREHRTGAEGKEEDGVGVVRELELLPQIKTEHTNCMKEPVMKDF